MLKKRYKLFVLSTVFLFFSCKQSDTSLPVSTGRFGSLVIVADEGIHTTLKQVYDSTFLKPLPERPAGEAFFDILKPDAEEFQRFYFNQRTVLALVSESSVEAMEELLKPFDDATIEKLINDKNPVLKIQANLFAKHQHIVYLFGKDANDLQRKLLLGREELNKTLKEFELTDEHEKLFNDSSVNDKYYDEMKEAFGIGVRIPEPFTLRKKENGVYLFQMDVKESKTPKTIGLVVHAYPFKDMTDFSYPAIRTVRDTVCKYLLEGEIKGTYMGTTESDYYPPVFRESITLNGNQCVKVRGWWTIRGMTMAGPFIRYVVHVPSKNLLFAFEGFVYKADLEIKERDLRLIESIALSIK